MSQELPLHEERKKPTSYIHEQLPPDVLLESELTLLAIAAGINDATTFPDYHVFSSNQTGNTALLAVGALGISEIVDLKDVGFSLGMFVLGGLILGQIGLKIGPTKRSWLLCTSIVQTCMVFTAAAVRQCISTGPDDTPRYAVISLLAFASGGQVAMARTVNVPEVNTAMVTLAYIDFVADSSLFAWHNRPRNRRGLFVLALLVGSFIGAVGYREVNPAFPLLLFGLIKTGVCIILFFNRENRRTIQS